MLCLSCLLIPSIACPVITPAALLLKCPALGIWSCGGKISFFSGFAGKGVVPPSFLRNELPQKNMTGVIRSLSYLGNE